MIYIYIHAPYMKGEKITVVVVVVAVDHPMLPFPLAKSDHTSKKAA